MNFLINIILLGYLLKDFYFFRNSTQGTYINELGIVTRL